MELTIKLPDEVAEQLRSHPDADEIVRRAVTLALADQPTPERVHRHRYSRVPKIDPKEWSEQPTFRETFLSRVADPQNNAAFRAFSQAQYHLALEAHGFWDGSFAEATAENLRAVVADLRHLQGFLTTDFESEVETLEEGYMTARKERLYRFLPVVAEKIAKLADEIEHELLESLQEEDDEKEEVWRPAL